jgi:hypothetical protein
MVSDPHSTPSASCYSQESGPCKECRPPHFNWMMKDENFQTPSYVSNEYVSYPALPLSLPPPPPYPNQNLHPCCHLICVYYQPGNRYHHPNHEYYLQYQHPVSAQYHYQYQPPVAPLYSRPIVPPMPLNRRMTEYIPLSTYNEQPQLEMDDPDAKLFIGE